MARGQCDTLKPHRTSFPRLHLFIKLQVASIPWESKENGSAAARLSSAAFSTAVAAN